MRIIKSDDFYKELLSKIDNKRSVDEIIPLIKRYSIQRMTADFAGKVSHEKIEEIANYIVDFISQCRKKGYLNDNNIHYHLRKMVIKEFELLPKNSLIFGMVGVDRDTTWDLKINPNTFQHNPKFNRLKHVIFHELSHAITPFIYGDGGIYTEAQTINDSRVLKNAKTAKEAIFVDDARRFLREVIAEATACDLLDDYEPLRTGVYYASQKEPSQKVVFSNWRTEFNRRYQELGDDFLRTMPALFRGSNDRERFKSLTIAAMNPNNNIVGDIITEFSKNRPNTWREDLHAITTTFAKIIRREGTTLYPDEVNTIKRITNFKPIRRSDDPADDIR